MQSSVSFPNSVHSICSPYGHPGQFVLPVRRRDRPARYHDHAAWAFSPLAFPIVSSAFSQEGDCTALRNRSTLIYAILGSGLYSVRFVVIYGTGQPPCNVGLGLQLVSLNDHDALQQVPSSHNAAAVTEVR